MSALRKKSAGVQDNSVINDEKSKQNSTKWILADIAYYYHFWIRYIYYLYYFKNPNFILMYGYLLGRDILTVKHVNLK